MMSEGIGFVRPRPGWLSPIGVRAGSTAFWAQAAALHLSLVIGYLFYSAIANRAPRHLAAALARTQHLVAFEARLHIGVEEPLNRWWAASHVRAVVGNYYYDAMHFAVPIGVLIWLVSAHPGKYRRALAVLVVASLLGLGIFWLLPVAPPRLLPHGGFVDTIATTHTIGSSGSHGLTNSENPLAAMPSLHVAWAAWAAAYVIALARSLRPRLLAVCHVVLTIFVIVATGNHLFADAAGGLLVLGLGARLVRAAAPFSR